MQKMFSVVRILLIMLLTLFLLQGIASSAEDCNKTFSVGDIDNLAAGGGPLDFTSPSTDLQAYMVGKSLGVKVLDDMTVNRVLGHTFTGLPPNILSATLTIHFKAGTVGMVDNDTINLELTGGTPAFAKSFSLKTLNGGTWAGPADEMTYDFDLDNLPDASSILANINADNALDVYIEDDTGVDYMILTVSTCCDTTFTAGDMDNLISVGGPLDSTSQGTALAGLMSGYLGGIRQFDDLTPNRVFGHTFTGLPSGIVSATLEIHLRAASGDITGNDSISLEILGTTAPYTSAWSSAIKNLPGAGTTWIPGQDLVITLDLDDLPLPGPGGGSVITNMQDNELDVYVQDDTGVDYMVLTVWTCCDNVLSAGVNDNFGPANDPELTSPSPDLAAHVASTYGPTREFDVVENDSAFIHTFEGLPPGIVSASLEIHLKAGTSGLADNDTLGLELVGIGLPLLCASAISDITGSWGANDDSVITVDLDNLPGACSVLGSINTDHALDVYIQDDTGVDYILLRVWTCCDNTLEAGVNDNFDPVNGPELTSPSQDLAAHMSGYPGPTREFDVVENDSVFGHTFTGLPPGIVSASLEIHLKAGTSGLANNDSIYLELVGGVAPFAWSASIGNADQFDTVGSWGANAETVLNLNLNDLFGGISILSNINLDHALDVYVQDDTGVDYIVLKVWACCDNPLEAGVNDNFSPANGPELTSPGPELQSFMTSVGAVPRDFDDVTLNKGFGHTFTGLPLDIVSGSLEIRFKAGVGALTDNDRINLELVGGVAPFSWSAFINELPGASVPWTDPGEFTVTLDLNNLPGGGSVLTDINLDQALDVYIQDDTGVDYMILKVSPCDTPTLITLSSFTASRSDGSVTLEWTTASEIDNAGFNIWRSEKKYGEYVKVNTDLITAEGAPLAGASYSFTDSTGVSGETTYYYRLEDIDTNGTSTFRSETNLLGKAGASASTAPASLDNGADVEENSGGCFIQTVVGFK